MTFTSFYSIYSKYLTIQTENRVSLDCETRFFDIQSAHILNKLSAVAEYLEEIRYQLYKEANKHINDVFVSLITDFTV